MRIQHQFLLYYSLFLAATTLISPSLGDLGKCHPSDFNALMKMKNYLTMSDEYFSWFQNTDCCEWKGIRCDSKTSRVVDFFFFVDGISGQIPPSVGDLSYLETLIFRNLKNITGSIPQSITKLKHLQLLDLDNMSLSGPVPNFLNQLPKLGYLLLSDNQFSGSIPPNLSDLKEIRYINLDGNKLTGSIPESFGKFSSALAELHLARNRLTGRIPKSLVDLYIIDFSRNKLTGDASMLFNGLRATYVDLSRNQFEFDLTKIKFPKVLNWLDISHNKVFGEIPDEIKGLENLQKLKLGYNRLCGKIPTGGIMTRFKRTSFFHNKCLCGSPLRNSCKKK